MISRVADLLRSEFRRLVPVGYDLGALRADLTSGLTVSVVALPLGLVVAIAAGATPDKGLVGIIVGGFVIALLTASRFQVGGPTEACILIAVVVIERFGYPGLMSATFIAGVILLAMAASRIGVLIESMPQPVITGFVTGMGIIIFTGQISPFLGLSTSGHEHDHGHAEAHSHSFPFLVEGLLDRIGNFDPGTFAVGVVSLGALLLSHRLAPRFPSYLVGLAAGSAAVPALGLSAATIGSTFGALPNRLPQPGFPPMDSILALLPYAVAIAVLSSSESLLAASMASRARGVANRPTREFLALGVANMAAAIWRGFPIGGCVARTATCLASGARSPLAGAFHAAFVLVFVFAFSWALAYIPLASLAAVLLVVAFRMVEPARWTALLRAPPGDVFLLFATLATTLFWDIRYVIPVGLGLGAVVFIHRVSRIFAVRRGDLALRDSVELVPPGAPLPDERPDGVEMVTFRGALFYGTVNGLSDLLARDERKHLACVFGMRNVHFMDPSACIALSDLVRKLDAGGTRCFFWGIQPEVAMVMQRMRLQSGVHLDFFLNAASAMEAAEARVRAVRGDSAPSAEPQPAPA